MSRLIIFIKGSIIAKILKQLRENGRRRLSWEYAQRKRIKNVIMNMKKKPKKERRIRNHSRVPNWIIYVRYVRYIRYCKVFFLYGLLQSPSWFVCARKSDYNLAAAWNYSVSGSVPSVGYTKIKITKNWIVFYEIYYNILYSIRRPMGL